MRVFYVHNARSNPARCLTSGQVLCQTVARLLFRLCMHVLVVARAGGKPIIYCATLLSNFVRANAASSRVCVSCASAAFPSAVSVPVLHHNTPLVLHPDLCVWVVCVLRVVCAYIKPNKNA